MIHYHVSDEHDSGHWAVGCSSSLVRPSCVLVQAFDGTKQMSRIGVTIQAARSMAALLRQGEAFVHAEDDSGRRVVVFERAGERLILDVVDHYDGRTARVAMDVAMLDAVADELDRRAGQAEKSDIGREEHLVQAKEALELERRAKGGQESE